MASIRRTTRCQLMAHLLIKTWYRRIGRSKLNTSEANYYQEQLRNGIPAEAGPNETSRLLGSQREKNTGPCVTSTPPPKIVAP